MLVAIAIAAVYPPLIVGGAALLSEPLFTVYLLAAVIAALLHRTTRAPRWAVAAGVLGGLSVLTRPNGALIVAILAAAVWDTARPRAVGAAKMPAVLLLAAVLIVAPWTLRNAIVLDRFVPLTTHGGLTLAGTYNETSRLDRRFPAAWRPPNFDPAINRQLARLTGRTEYEINRELGSAALRYAREHPGYVVTVAWQNLGRLLNLGGRDFHHLATFSEVRLGPRWSDLAMYGFFPFALLALAGACSPLARAAPRFVWLVPLAMASAVLISTTQRFRVPIDPFIVLLASAAVCWALRTRPRAMA